MIENKFTLEFMTERLTNRYTDIHITFTCDDGWMIRWGFDPQYDPYAEEDENWGATFRDSTLRGVLEAAYWGLIN